METPGGHPVTLFNGIKIEYEPATDGVAASSNSQEVAIKIPNNVKYEYSVNDVHGAGVIVPAVRSYPFLDVVQRECNAINLSNEIFTDTTAHLATQNVKSEPEIAASEEKVLSACAITDLVANMKVKKEDESNVIHELVGYSCGSSDDKKKLSLVSLEVDSSKDTRADVTAQNVKSEPEITAFEEKVLSACAITDLVANMMVKKEDESNVIHELVGYSCGSSDDKKKLSLVSLEVENSSEEIYWKNCRQNCSYDNTSLSIQGESSDNRVLAKLSNKSKIQTSMQNGENLFKHESCPAKFAQRENLKNHLVKHSNDRPFSCTDCPIKFKQNSDLKMHIKLVHMNERPFSCNLCPARFKQKSSLKRHNTHLHSVEKPFSCNLCSATFKTQSNKKVHMEGVHNNERKFICDICSATFKRKVHVKVHIWTHSDEKPYKCKQCSATFKQSRTLKTHTAVHSSERRFTCHLCSATLKRKDALFNHLRRHFDVKPFKCKECPAAFINNYILKSHEKVHSGEKPIKCDQCSARFKRRLSLINHIKWMHNREQR